MPLPLQNLDTRRYGDLVDDAHALIPRYAPSWTNHNESDPGITLVELLAWLVEQDMYRVNRIPERHRRKFLELTGLAPEPPRAARAVLSLSASTSRVVPIGTRFSAGEVHFTSTNRVHIAVSRLAAVQSWDGAQYSDLTASWQAGLPLPAWGTDPTGFDGDNPPALLLGFDGPLPHYGMTLWLGFERGGDRAEAQLIADEQAAELAACAALRPRARCNGESGPETTTGLGRCTGGDCLATVWEIWRGGEWHAIQAVDATDGLMLDGLVRVVPLHDGDPRQLGAFPQPLRWVRCRASQGVPDRAPLVRAIAVNAVVVEQRGPASGRLELAPGANLPATPLLPGRRARLVFEFDAAGRVTRVRRTSRRDVPKVRVLDIDADSLEVTLAIAGGGLGIPELSLELDAAPVADGAIGVWSGEDGWTARADLDAAQPRDRDFVLDPQAGTLTFGDGEHGLAPRAGTTLLAAYDVTLGAAGNLPTGASWSAPDMPAVEVTACGTASGGADAEDLEHAAGRAAETLWAHERLLELAAAAPTLDGLGRDAITALAPPQRAATTLDYERLALSVPGTRVERARAWGEIDANSPGLRAPGTVTVVVVNSLPADRPQPSRCLLDRVHRYLRRRKTLGTRLVVAGPDYVEVTAGAVLAILPGADAAGVTARALDVLNDFLAPRLWPFGRDVFRAEVLALLDGVQGVDAVGSLELTADGGGPSCGNVCVGPTQLVVSGAHSVTVAT